MKSMKRFIPNNKANASKEKDILLLPFMLDKTYIYMLTQQKKITKKIKYAFQDQNWLHSFVFSFDNIVYLLRKILTYLNW